MPGISDLLDSDMENNSNFLDENSLISSVSDAIDTVQSKATSKKPRKRKCVTMPKKSRTTKVKAESEQPAEGAERKRKATAMEVNAEGEEVYDNEKGAKRLVSKQDVAEPASKPTKTKSTKRAIAPTDAEVAEPIPSPVHMRSNFAATKAVKPYPRPVSEGKSKAASRALRVAAKATENVVSDMEEEEIDAHVPRKRARTEQVVRQEPSYRRRAGSVSDTERGDPLLRRKLGDVTRKYENLEIKFNNLKELAVNEAHRNFENVRRECDHEREVSQKVIGSLKQQLAEQGPAMQECRRLKKDVQQYESESKKLRAANSDLTSTLTAAQNEIKSLQAKLSAARATPAPIDPKVPASINKHVPQTAKQVTSTSNGDASHRQQLKLDLYSDLTGLIIRDVKEADDGATYDCIQTGRDGRALHFKLFIDQEEAKKANPDEQEFLYTPLLDASRDRELISVMPSYLSEDITFAREVAARFYGRVVETVMKRTTVPEDEVSE